ncbi:MAG: transporter substrate-binding domain-containing protein [Acidimicrobiales bacterium]|jgi:ABC-type amino acid transport substrate-binding protein
MTLAAMGLAGMGLLGSLLVTSAGQASATNHQPQASVNGNVAAARAVIASEKAAPASMIPAGSPMAAIKKQGYLIYGGALDAPLLSQENPVNGDVEGFDADMGKLLAKYITGRADIKVVSAETTTREALLENHTVNVVLETYTITVQRARVVNFAGPYLADGVSIAVKKGATGIASFANLAGKTVIAGADTPAIPLIKKMAPTAKIITFATDPDCVQALIDGRGAAYVQDYVTLAGDAVAGEPISIVGHQVNDGYLGIGVPKDQPTMVTFVNNWLKMIEKNGQWAGIWKATFGTVEAGGPPAPPTVGTVPGVPSSLLG